MSSQAVPTTQATETEHPGCGWFNSSYDLQEGLTVTEDVDLCLFELWSEAYAERCGTRH